MAELELDLHGLHVEEALARLEPFLNDVFLAGLIEVHIIHGKGSGALRQAVQETLRKHPLVKSFRSGIYGEGGPGVTIVRIAER